jgi:hypothetical protein
LKTEGKKTKKEKGKREKLAKKKKEKHYGLLFVIHSALCVGEQ